MATAQERRRARAATARAHASGESRLPRATTSRARKAASFIGEFHPDDRDRIIDIKMHGWWDNDAGLDDYRHEGMIESVWNYANDYVAHGVPSSLINITPGSNQRNFYIYAARTS